MANLPNTDKKLKRSQKKICNSIHSKVRYKIKTLFKAGQKQILIRIYDTKLIIFYIITR